MTLTKAGIAVDELRFPENLSLDVLSLYDLVFVLDPCAWAYAVDGFAYERIGLYSYSTGELEAYSDYFANGGNLFLAGLSNDSLDFGQANRLFSQFNITLNDDQIPDITIVVNGLSSTELISGLISHPITEGVDAFDYNGCSLNFTGTTYRTVLVGLENNNTGRLIATGTNFFLDNWALTGHYKSKQDLLFVWQAVSWLLRVLET